MRKPADYHRPQTFAYGFAWFVSGILSLFVYHRKVLRNEIKKVKGPYVVVANHECALDAVNLGTLTRRKMTFVVSYSFFNSLPVRGLLQRIGVIAKQQFQTEIADLKKMKAVIRAGEPLVLYPAGLMTENGLSTPVPESTWKFLKWMDADVYAARTYGSYFVMPKWAKGFRPGRTTMDVYLLFSKEELRNLSIEEIRERYRKALDFDAYRDQEQHPVCYRGADDIRGLEHVLYRCPECRKKYTLEITGKSTLHCSCCGFTETADKYGFLHNKEQPEKEIRYVSDWSRKITEIAEEETKNENFSYFLNCAFQLLNDKTHHFETVGSGSMELTADKVHLKGTVNGEVLDFKKDVLGYPCLPFSPGKYVEIQDGRTIWRCLPEDGRKVMEFIDFLRILNGKAKKNAAYDQDAEAAGNPA